MQRRSRLPLLVSAVCACSLAAQAQSTSGPAAISKDYPVQPVPFTAVHIQDQFWAPRIEINRTVTIPFAFEQCEQTGRVDNFVHAAQALHGELKGDVPMPGFPFDDTDVYKVIEGASYALSVHPDPKLDTYVDSLIAKIAAAQERDGYLYTTRTINPKHPHEWSGENRWEKEEVLSHELYNLGHLYEAAVAHYQATGKRNLLDVATRSADLLVATFGPGKKSIWPGHQITEMGLVKLYRVTGKEDYLNLAKFLLDQRGPGKDAYNQAHLRVVDQTEGVGHAVRATYMYSGMADVAAMTGDRDYVHAIDTIWNNVVSKKLYITGGIGSKAAGEAFGKDYELPNMTAYNETCAAIGNGYWNYRLFLLHADAKYIDVMERTLYNGLISGVSLDGKGFFYPNPLESAGQHKRSPWFGCACCPGNITRFLASVPGYVYAVQGDTVFVNLYAANSAQVPLKGGAVELRQETRYPWDGAVRVTVTPTHAQEFAMKVRIPGWVRNEAVPGDLYRFEGSAPAWQVKLNGKPVQGEVEHGYVTVQRTWTAGDLIELDLPMPVRRVKANEAVAADRGRVAIQRGPLVYAAEWPEFADHHVRNLVLPDRAALKAEVAPSLLNGVVTVKGEAVALRKTASGKVAEQKVAFTAIPYYAWANRGKGEMTVWLADSVAAGKPLAAPTVATTANVTSSPAGEKDPSIVRSGDEPRSSFDADLHFDWWPKKGSTEWIEYQFAQPAQLSHAQVYWFDDTGEGEVRVPSSWRLLYLDGTEWKPVAVHGDYGVVKDRYNAVSFASVRTTALRLEVTAQPKFAAGVLQWQVE